MDERRWGSSRSCSASMEGLGAPGGPGGTWHPATFWPLSGSLLTFPHLPLSHDRLPLATPSRHFLAGPGPWPCLAVPPQTRPLHAPPKGVA